MVDIQLSKSFTLFLDSSLLKSISSSPNTDCRRNGRSIINEMKRHQMHAAQIYVEMLGLVCHRELNTSHPNGYQEVPYFVDSVDSRHLLFMRDMLLFTFSTPIFQILISATSRYGAEYKQRVANPIKIAIRQPQSYGMRYPHQQAEFFRLLSRILYQMVSGYSNVGYLAKTSGIHITMAFLGYLPGESGLMVDDV
jgi:hypothetical protein